MDLNIIQVVYDKSISNIILNIPNGEKTEIISSKVRNETKVSTTSILLNIFLEFVTKPKGI
jgi:hypothetical protein